MYPGFVARIRPTSTVALVLAARVPVAGQRPIAEQSEKNKSGKGQVWNRRVWEGLPLKGAQALAYLEPDRFRLKHFCFDLKRESVSKTKA